MNPVSLACKPLEFLFPVIRIKRYFLVYFYMDKFSKNSFRAEKRGMSNSRT